MHVGPPLSDLVDTWEGVRPIQTVTLSLFRFPGAAGALWALGQMGAARLDFARGTGATFWKLCGSGAGTGFTGVDPHAWAILAAWPDAATARDRIADAAPWRRWRARAAEVCDILLSPVSSRGLWSGRVPFDPAPSPAPGRRSGPMAVLTRATIRAPRAPRFWSRAPGVQDAIARDPNVLFRVGIGEMPFLHQVTFSIWPDTRSMTAFAHAPGPHADAIRAVRQGGWFREELYARFAVIEARGTWRGAPPLHRPEEIAA